MFGINVTKILFSATSNNVILSHTTTAACCSSMSMSTSTNCRLMRIQSVKLLSTISSSSSTNTSLSQKKNVDTVLLTQFVRNYSFLRQSKGDEGANKDLTVEADPTSEVPPPAPVIIGRDLHVFDECRTPRQAWVENLDTVEEKKLGLVDLHPDVFGAFPRTDLISGNVMWQKKYKHVNWDWTPTRGELRGGGRKPWPQKGLGKARHGSLRSPIFLRGSKTHGPRGPKTYFYMYPFYKRVQGLCATLSAKFAQDDLKIVDSLDIPNEDPQFLQDLIEARKWGISVLFVDDADIVPKNIALATDTVNHLNLMPVYGLNVYSMLKHETLVLTVAAVNRLEERLLFHLNRHDSITPAMRYRGGFV